VAKVAVSGRQLICTEKHGEKVSHSPDDYQNHQLKVEVHSLGYVADSTKEAVDDFFPGYTHTMTKLGKERGWHKVTRTAFEA
jgi:hypothetical protein